MLNITLGDSVEELVTLLSQSLKFKKGCQKCNSVVYYNQLWFIHYRNFVVICYKKPLGGDTQVWCHLDLRYIEYMK